ncbi:hypothetical protein Tco_1200165 [Tanacetum coccineum]
MVAFLEKSAGSDGFHQVINFLNRSHISYALTKKPKVFISFIKQFWNTAEASTDTDGEVTITATIDGQSKTITEESLRRHLKLEDPTNSDKLTFQKGIFSPQWRFLIHIILHYLSPKKTAWEQFSSNIATALICLATNRKYNFSRLIVTNIGVEVELFPSMITIPTPETSPTPLSLPSRITSSLSQTSEPQPSPAAEDPVLSPNESPLHAVYLHGSDEGSLKLNELPNLVTKLAERIRVLEDDLKKTKQTYSSAFTKLILRVKKLESIVKTGKARKRARVMLLEDEEDDSSKQVRKISDIDEDPNT